MKYLKNAVRATTTLGVLGLAMSANAYVYGPYYPVIETHGLKGPNTSSSFAAASIMGEKGFSDTYNGVVSPTLFSAPPTGWEDAITSTCKIQTLTMYGSSLWPTACNPVGMAVALNSLDGVRGAHWVVRTDPNTPGGKSDILNWIFASIYTYYSPAVVPIFGQADHFVSVTQFDATPFIDPYGYLAFYVNLVSFYDGGGLGTNPAAPFTDSSLVHQYMRGLQTFDGATFANSYTSVVTAINQGCDPFCTSDPFYNQFVLLYEPPGQPHLDGPSSFAKASGVEPRGAMNAAKAQNRVWDALVAAGINNDPATWDPISGAVAGPAVLVNGVFPDGSPWNYYLVPLLTDASSAIAFAQLSADDGSFQHLQVFDSPMPYTPVTQTKAKQLAGGVLAKGDRLTTDGVLTWNPRSDSELARSPSAPYYEFGVIDANGKSTTARVLHHDGTAVRGRVHDGTVVRGH